MIPNSVALPIIIFLFLAGVSLPAFAENAANLRVWTAYSTEKILSDSSLRDTQVLDIYAARGEYESMQIVLHSQTDIDDVHVSCNRLESSDGVTFPENAIRFRRVECIHDTPDVLVPFERLSLSRNKNLIIWMTVYIPRETPPGLYQGSLEISSPQGHTHLPVRITVWSFTLPVTPSLPAVAGIHDRMFKDRYGLTPQTPDWANRMDDWYQLLLSYRIAPYFCEWLEGSMKHDAYPAPWPVRYPETASYLEDPRLSAFAIPYHGLDENTLRSNLEYLEKKGWIDRGYLYLWDEPTLLSEYAQLHEWAEEIRAIAPNARILTTYYCGPKDEGPHKDDLYAVPELLRGATHIFCMSTWAFGDQQEKMNAKMKTILQSDEEWWSYVCLAPGEPHPNLFLSMTGIQHRAVMWRAWKEQGAGFLYWAVNAYAAGGAASEPVTLREGLPAGDGVLMYPGEPYGVSGPLASARLERLRDGLEDYEYLRAYAERFGYEQAVALLKPVYTNAENYTDEHDSIESMRQRIISELQEQ